MLNKYTTSAAFMLGLCGCSGTHTSDYAGTQPVVTVQDFYSAPVEGYGFFQDTNGKVGDRFYAVLIPSWHGNEGTLTEKQWNDKGKLFLQQTWTIHLADNGHDFTGAATKIDGPVHGETNGYALHMTYTMMTTTGSGKEINLDADDWTYLQPDGSGINKVALSKYGFHVGDVIYDLHKVPDGESPHEGYFEE